MRMIKRSFESRKQSNLVQICIHHYLVVIICQGRKLYISVQKRECTCSPRPDPLTSTTNNKTIRSKNNNDIVMTVLLDEKTLTWKTDSNGQAKPLYNTASSVHRIRSNEILCDYLHQAAGYPVKKTWL